LWVRDLNFIMVIKIKLKNSGNHVLVDHVVYDELSQLPYFLEHSVLDNLREHSTGVPVFQKFMRLDNGKCKVKSVYLNSYIANKYVARPAGSHGRLFLTYLNGNKLDCRLKNLRWDTMASLSRQRSTHRNKTGFRGVRKTPDGKYVSMISNQVKQIYLGTFLTAEEAALAYNKKSIELFGETGSLNPIGSNGQPVPTGKKQETDFSKKKKS
jgi:hypothetical protein